jgi:hypothetical protein
VDLVASEDMMDKLLSTVCLLVVMEAVDLMAIMGQLFIDDMMDKLVCSGTRK